MGLPKIAIVGRPNVGKSALFNRIYGRRLAIVDEAEGITRDRLYAQAEVFGRPFEVIDTGGIDPRSKAPFNEQIKRQAEIAIEEADGLILVVDGQVGPTSLDLELARLLQRTDKPLTLAVNKIDDRTHEPAIHDFHAMGITSMVGVSAAHGLYLAELLETILCRIPEGTLSADETGIQLAIVGRTNVGKSTLINTLLHEERCLVSPIAGTTRDSIDIRFESGGESFTLIDTAGIRRKPAEKAAVDKFAAIRTERAIGQADICVLLVDAEEGLTTQDKRIATTIEETGKGCVVLVNKWDKVTGCRMEHALKALRDDCHFLAHCPLIVGSALTGRNLDQVLASVIEVAKERTKKIATARLNKFIEKTLQLNHPPVLRGRRLRIYYLTQIGTAPPRFLLFVNAPDLLAPHFKRFLLNQFRKAFGFTGNPLTFQLRGKERREKLTEIRYAPSTSHSNDTDNELLNENVPEFLDSSTL